MGFLLGGLNEKLRRTISPRKGNMVISPRKGNMVISPLDNLVVPRGHFPVYVGKKHKRFVIPIWYLNEPLFQQLLHLAEQEFGYDHPMGALTIPCNEDYFLTLTSLLTS